jgi:hypothetical protein
MMDSCLATGRSLVGSAIYQRNQFPLVTQHGIMDTHQRRTSWWFALLSRRMRR